MEKTLVTAQGTFTIRPFKESDLSGVLALWKAAFHKEMPEELWKWKYFDNPFDLRMMVCIAETGEFAALFAGLPYPAQWNGRKTYFLHAVDNMSHPRFRGVLSGKKGLFVRTAEHFFDCYTGPEQSIFVYGYPGRRHFLLGKRLLGYQTLTRTFTYLVAETKSSSRFRCFPWIRVNRAAEAETAFDRLAEESRGKYPFTILRNSSFIRWRFFSHPFQSYQLWCHRSPFVARIKGYAAVQRDGPKARLVDLFHIGNPDEAERMLRRLLSELASQDVGAVETWIPERHFLIQALKRVGFKEKEEPLGVVPACLNRSFHPELDIRWASNHLFYTMADADLF